MLLTKPEAAEFLRISTRTLDRERKRGSLAWVAVGGSVRFERSELQRYLERGSRICSPTIDLQFNYMEEFAASLISLGDPPSVTVSPTAPEPDVGKGPSQVFELARFLIGHDYPHPKSCELLVKSFCMRRLLDFDDAWVEINQVWGTIEYPDYGYNGFDAAVRLAKSNPVSLSKIPPDPVPSYVLLASIAFHLSKHTRGRPFLLPVQDLAQVMGFKETWTVSRIKRWLLRNNFIKCVDDTYHFGPGKPRGKKYTLGQIPLRTDKTTKCDISCSLPSSRA